MFFAHHSFFKACFMAESSQRLTSFGESKLCPPRAGDLQPQVDFNSSWSFYADDHHLVIGETKPEYHDPTLIFANISNVDLFWRVLHHSPLPSTRSAPFTFFYFRKDIKPNWEEAKNKNGGTVNVCVYDRDRQGLQDKNAADDAWVALLMSCVGESLPEPTMVNGVSFKVRKAYTLQIWTATTARQQLHTLVDAIKKVLLPLVPRCTEKIEFFAHIQSLTASKQRSTKFANAKLPQKTREPDFIF